MMTFDELLRRAEKYMILEEMRKPKKAELRHAASKKKKEVETKVVNHEPTQHYSVRTLREVREVQFETAEVLDVAADHLEIKFPWSRSWDP